MNDFLFRVTRHIWVISLLYACRFSANGINLSRIAAQVEIRKESIKGWDENTGSHNVSKIEGRMYVMMNTEYSIRFLSNVVECATVKRFFPESRAETRF